MKVFATFSCFKTDVFLERLSYLGSPAESPLVSVRGRESGAHRGCNTFTWSKAVRAFALLLVSGRLAVLRSDESLGLLKGGKGSLAASLDYAISKQPRWLVDLFGTGADGVSRVRRIILRTNPERKRGDIVTLRLNPTYFRDDALEILLGERPLVDSAKLLELCARLSDGHHEKHEAPFVFSTHLKEVNPSCWPVIDAANVQHRNENAEPEQTVRIVNAFREELHYALRRTVVFNQDALRRTVGALSQDKDYRALTGGREAPIVSEIELAHRPAESLGVDYEGSATLLLRGADLDVTLSPRPGPMALLLGLSQLKAIPLRVDRNFSHCQQVLEHVVRGSCAPPPKLVVLGIAQAARLLGSLPEAYAPLMFLPMTGHVLAGQQRKATAPFKGRLIVYEDSDFYTNQLRREGLLRSQLSNLTPLSTEMVSRALLSGDPDVRAFVWFPHNLFMGSSESSAQALWSSWTDDASRKSLSAVKAGSSVLLMRRDLFKAPLARALSLVIRDVWRSIIESPSLESRIAYELATAMTLSRHLARAHSPECEP